MYDISNTLNINTTNCQPSITTGIIITPYEKVLTILNNVKKYINSTSKRQSKLIKNLDWVIKVITSHSLYAYELKEKDLISKLSKQNNDFKNFVDFVSKYNEQVIEMNKKNIILGAKTIDIANELLQKPSINLKKNISRTKIAKTPNKYNAKKMKITKNNKQNEKNEPNTPSNAHKWKKYSITIFDDEIKNARINRVNSINNKRHSDEANKIKYGNNMLKSNFSNNEENVNNSENINKKKSDNIKMSKSYFVNIKQYNSINIPKKMKSNKKMSSYKIKKQIDLYNSYNNIKENKYIEKLNKSGFNLTFNYIDSLLNDSNFNQKSILEKEFNIFELEKKVGHSNVLPIMGRVMLDSFGLINDKIMPIEKLDAFLYSVANQYLTTTLYHNSLHGADITQTICVFFNNSNAEEICHTKAIDLLSIIIAGLGHDIGHPGLTNTFQVNSLSEMAITYNDISCLENFHLAKLFKTLRKDETNIFEKLSTQDFKKIRKKMISEILATDMAIHGKVLNNIRSKIPESLLLESNNNSNISNGHKKFDLITDINNEMTTNEEQQALFDYFIHSADLAHNTKKFKISLKWVELLSNEFWLQGDKEKKMNLSVSFLCDRNNTDVPKSQVGFIGGFVIPTFNFLIIMFPSLSFTVKNAKDNIKEWQKLVDQKRKKGWTPPKLKKNDDENKNKKDGNIKKKKETIVVDIKI
jgi:hypothetical protein